MRIVSSQEMKEIEKEAQQKYGLTESLVDENVGIRGADFLYRTYLKQQSYGEIVVLVGKGNNGADGLSIARHLKVYGLSLRAFLLYPESECSEPLLKALGLARNFGIKISEVKNVEQMVSYFRETQEQFFVIDAIFGTGVRHPLPVFFGDIITLANDYASIMVAVDLPSGIMGDTGKSAGFAIKADCTLAIALPKLGHYISTGASMKGGLKVIDAGFPPKLLSGGDKALLLPFDASQIFSDRNKYAHKNIFGHALVIGGSFGLTGAILLAAMAALKVGAGQVTAVTWEKNYQELVARADPEMITGVIPEQEEAGEALLKTLHRYNSIVIGPGMGKGPESRKVVLRVLSSYPGPVILDADAINALTLKEDGEFLSARKAPTVLTPHIGEFARFAGITKDEVLEKPIYWLKKLIDDTNCSILMKGACSYLGLPNGEVYFNDFPNDGMATGGSGDVLAGVLAGVIAQNTLDKINPMDYQNNKRFYESLCLGVVIHSLAGKHAALNLGKRTMTASSIIVHLSKAFFELENDYEKGNKLAESEGGYSHSSQLFL